MSLFQTDKQRESIHKECFRIKLDGLHMNSDIDQQIKISAGYTARANVQPNEKKVLNDL